MPLKTQNQAKVQEYDTLVRLQHRLFIDGQKDRARRELAISELICESYHNPIVKSYLDAWMDGHYENIEMALCAMAAQLSKENTRFRDCIIKAYRTNGTDND